MDIISALPDQFIGLILQRLSLTDRVRTSVLSKHWRRRWTCIPSLEMDYMFCNSLQRKPSPLEFTNIINSISEQYCGGIRDFNLFIPDSQLPSLSLFHQSICLVLENNNIEALCLQAGMTGDMLYPIPSIFSSVNLKRLELSYFYFHLPPTFKGFPNLKILILMSNRSTTRDDTFSPTTYTISRFISVCPQLEEVTLDEMWWVGQDHLQVESPKLRTLLIGGDFKDVFVSNAPNLESVELWLNDMPNDGYVCKHFNSLAHVERMVLGYSFCKFLGRCSVIHMLPRFDRLKSIKCFQMDPHDKDVLTCVLNLLAASSNITELTLGYTCEDYVPPNPLNPRGMIEKYINDDFRHLSIIELRSIRASKIDSRMIEQLLRFTPVLEKMVVVFARAPTYDEKIKFLSAMLNFYRASTIVKFEINYTL